MRYLTKPCRCNLEAAREGVPKGPVLLAHKPLTALRKKRERREGRKKDKNQDRRA